MTIAGADWVAWFGTYALHSTAVLGATWAIFRLKGVGAGVRERAWKCALALPLVTATLQVAWPENVVTPRFELTAAAVAPAPTPAELLTELETMTAVPTVEKPASPNGVDEAAAAPPFGPAAAFAALVALLAACAVLLPVIRLALALRRRRPLETGVLVEETEALRRRAGIRRKVRVTVSERVGSPVAIGTLLPEICVPPRALDLPRPLARAMIAHELAHHARFDPLWTRITHAIAAALFLQPLNRIARRELLASAELLADDLAVEWTDDRFGLARCLTEVAAWERPSAPAAVAVAMVRHAKRSSLRERVERALDRPRERVVRGLAPLALALGVAVAAAAPGIARQAPEVGAAGVLLRELRTELSQLASELHELGEHHDPSIQDQAAALSVRRVQLEATAQHLARALSMLAREDKSPGDPIR